jgi:RimJ/RimL family protein N-acetyltransferase
MRERYRREMSCQIVHDSWHARGFTDAWLLDRDGAVAGYGAVAGDPEGPREVIREFWVAPADRTDAPALFEALVTASGARRIVAQTNDPLLAPFLASCPGEPGELALLFSEGPGTSLPSGGATFRPLSDDDRTRAFGHTREPVGDWGLELGGAIVATGGILLHYNPPYADLFMEVAAGFRNRGLGSYLVQELRHQCRRSGRVPAARCAPDNAASRRTLERAGMIVCARLLDARMAGQGGCPPRA